MRKLLNKPWVVAVLAVLAVALVAHSLLDRAPTPRPVAVAMPEPAPADVEFAEDGTPVGATLAEALRKLSLPEQLPDPFALRRARVDPSVEQVAERLPDQSESFHLSAIWEQDGAAFVVLNGRICRSGDVLGRITVDAVEREGVWLHHWKGRDFVRLGQNFTLVTPAAEAANLKTATHEG